MEHGLLTFATDARYVEIAYLSALSFKLANSEHGYAVGIPTDLLPHVPEKYKEVMTFLDAGPYPTTRYGLEGMAILSPYSRVTVKVDADMLFPSTFMYDFDALDAALKHVDILFGEPITHLQEQVDWKSPYKEACYANGLPAVYSTATAFRVSSEIHLMFYLVRELLQEWDYASPQFMYPQTRPAVPATDECYAIAASSSVAWSFTKLLPFVHMKLGTMFRKVQGQATEGTVWTALLPFVVTETCDLYVDNQLQAYPIHYVDKGLCTKTLIAKYERLLGV